VNSTGTNPALPRSPATCRRGPALGRNSAEETLLPKLARLIGKVYEVDPLLCTRCGERLSIVAGLSPEPQQKPPPV
jgi:hypothetical protein